MQGAVTYFRGLNFEDPNWIVIIDSFMQLEVALDFPNNSVRSIAYIHHRRSLAETAMTRSRILDYGMANHQEKKR